MDGEHDDGDLCRTAGVGARKRRDHTVKWVDGDMQESRPKKDMHGTGGEAGKFRWEKCGHGEGWKRRRAWVTGWL